MGFEQAIQQLVFSLLTAYQPLNEIVTGIYDYVPQNEEFPYVTIGENSLEAWDTDTELGTSALVTINVWAGSLNRETLYPRGMKEVQRIQAEIYNALQRKQPPPPEGYHVVSIDWRSSETVRDTDGSTRRGIQVFHVILEEVA